MIQTASELEVSAKSDAAPPGDLSLELTALWHAKAGDWEASHNIAQDIETELGFWIHAHLHLIEGDIGNAGYWYNRARRPAGDSGDLDREWVEIVTVALAQG